MANNSQIKALINEKITTNGTGAITGSELNNVLTQMVLLIGQGRAFAGIATPSGTPSTYDRNVFWLATAAGTYTNFGGLVIPEGLSVILYNEVEGVGSYSFNTLIEIDDEVTSESVNLVSSGAIYTAIQTAIQAVEQGATEIYDVSGNNNGASYATLAAALALVPQVLQKGGISVKYIDSTSGEYVQYRLLATSWSTNSSDWEKAGMALLYNSTGENTDGAMTQKAVTDEIEGFIKTTRNDPNSVFYISDENGNVIASFKDGHIKTKNFDSSEIEGSTPVRDDTSSADLNLCDEQGNVIMRLSNGHLKTKNFDSEFIDEGINNLPDYWKSYLDSLIVDLKAEEDGLGRNGAAFVFFTDIHWNDNYKHSPDIINYILKNTNIKDVICGGDVIVGHGAKTAKTTEMKDFCNALSKTPCINIVGNHDYNTSDQPSADWDERITPQEHYRIAMSTSERVVLYDQLEGEDAGVSQDYNYPKSNYTKNTGRYPEYFGYVDNKSQKMRYIFLDSTCVHVPASGMTTADLRISDNQLIWMQEKITELESGWTVVVFSHIGIAPSTSTLAYTVEDATSTTEAKAYNIGYQIINAIDAIYDEASNNGVSIAGILCGHCHKDLDLTLPKGYVFISTTCDARSQAQAQNDPNGYSNGGDTDEQAIDVCFIDTENKTITIKRIGEGNDRTFNYQ